jgi:hypothetical protein
MPAALVLRSRLKSFSSLLVPVSRLPPVLWSPTRPAAIVRPSRPSHEVFSPFDDFRCGKRPTPELPPSASLRPQVFSTSRRVIPSTPFRPCFMPISSRFSPSEFPPDASLACLSAPSAPLVVSRHVQRTYRSNSRDSCNRQVRTIPLGVTQKQTAVPLLVFAPPRFPSLGLDVPKDVSSHGLQHDAALEPKFTVIVMLALQSFKEPRS